MIDAMGSLLNSMYNTSQSSYVNSTSQIYDYKAAQNQTKDWLDGYKATGNKLTTLKKDTADFLDGYTKNLNELNSAAGKLMGGGIDKLLYGSDGEVTEDTVKATVDAVQKMVDQYNTSLAFLGKNTDRGPGVEAQIARMSDDPASKEGMALVGVSVGADGTLALDTEKLTAILNSENSLQRDLAADILGGSNGIAAGVRRDASAGLNRSANSLVAYDIAEMQGLQSDDPIRSYAASMRSAGAYGYNNMAAVGILMNLTA